jgi:hypothetical protein
MTASTCYTYTHAPRVTVGWGSLTLGAMLLPLTNMALLARGHNLTGESIGKNARAAALCAGIIASPWLTAHELGPDRLVIRQGLNFHGEINYCDIASVHATERKPTHFPMQLYRHTLFLALWPVDLVSVRLRRPQRFRMFRAVPVWKVREVVINVDRRDAFVADLRARVAAAGMREIEKP